MRKGWAKRITLDFWDIWWNHPLISLFFFHTLNEQINFWTKREMFDSFTRNLEYVTGLLMENELFHGQRGHWVHNRQIKIWSISQEQDRVNLRKSCWSWHEKKLQDASLLILETVQTNWWENHRKDFKTRDIFILGKNPENPQSHNSCFTAFFSVAFSMFKLKLFFLLHSFTQMLSCRCLVETTGPETLMTKRISFLFLKIHTTTNILYIC